MVQRYKNESKSQPVYLQRVQKRSCFQWFKDTKMRANHNPVARLNTMRRAVSNGSKILK